MRFLTPALVLLALTGAVSCAKRLPTPLTTPVTPAPTADISRTAALALLRSRLEAQSTRRRVRLPADAHIALTPASAGAYTFRCAYYEYVPATSLPWVYTAAGRVDLATRRVTLTALVAEVSSGPVPSPTPVARPVAAAPGLGMIQ